MARGRARRRRRYAAFWGGGYYLFGLLTVLLATTAGAGALGEVVSKDVAAVLSIAAALSAAVTTFLDSRKRQRENIEAGAAWQKLASKASLELSRLLHTPPASDAPESVKPVGVLQRLYDIEGQLLQEKYDEG